MSAEFRAHFKMTVAQAPRLRYSGKLIFLVTGFT